MLSCRLESKDTFYDTLCEWWADWKFPVVAITSLPERIFVVSNDGVDLYAIPVYFGDSSCVTQPCLIDTLRHRPSVT